MTITQEIGDTVTHHIPMRWGKAPFEAGAAWNLIWTLKADPNDSDAQAKIQKQYGQGVTSSGTTASVSLIHEDTAGGVINEGQEDEVTLVALTAGTYYWDIQAQRIAEPHDVRTVRKGEFELTRDITRSTTNTLPIFTTSPAAPIQVPVAGDSAYDIAVDNGFVGTEEEWLASLQGEDGEGTNNTTISGTAPANPQNGDIWIDTNGWIESYWVADIDPETEIDNGYWVSKQPLPNPSTYLYYDLDPVVYEDGELTYNLVYEP